MNVLAALGILAPGRVLLQASREQSVPFRLALQLGAPAVWASGELVAFRTRDLRPYFLAGVHFAKLVAAVPGDALRIVGRDFYVNGRYLGTARTTDSLGRPAPLYTPAIDAAGTCSPLPAGESRQSGSLECRVPEGALFVFGTHERSFDSRYWGLVQASEVIGRVVPLL